MEISLPNLVSPKLSEILSLEADVDKIVESILIQNPLKRRFYLNGEYGLEKGMIIPGLILEDLVYQGNDDDFIYYVYEKLNEYMCEVLDNPKSYVRDRPWKKPHIGFETDAYEDVKIPFNLITSHDGIKKYMGCRADLIEVLFPPYFIIPKELYILLTYHHQYILPSFGYTFQNDGAFLIAQYAHYDLMSFANEKPITNQNKVRIFQQLASVVWFLHTKMVFGMSLSPKKVKIIREDMVEVRLYDFSQADVWKDCDERDFEELKKNDIFELGKCFYWVTYGEEWGGRISLDGDNSIVEILGKMLADEDRPSAEQVCRFLRRLDIN
ncbi:hypothetical protein SteCoe_31936 [Stentor coeruleus]|uniref:Protein kinase domain-containing protein n=1 Tax=Stentor coeruleus TaxID=5963 RepID=A0A1R2B093_9CILI|nr:hypothetical protein SteCoe_31936 [Stentor coeruleus]